MHLNAFPCYVQVTVHCHNNWSQYPGIHACMCLSSSGTVESCSVEVYPTDWVFLYIYPLQSTVEGILGSEGPAEDDSEAREEAERLLVDIGKVLGDRVTYKRAWLPTRLNILA